MDNKSTERTWGKKSKTVFIEESDRPGLNTGSTV